MSLYDRLTNKLGDEEPSGGLTPLDIADLPTPQRKVMFSLLRDTKAATEGISKEQINKKLEDPLELDNTLADLVKSGWLIETGEHPHVRYKVNIRRKRISSLGFGIWSSLSERITSKLEEFEGSEGAPAQRSSVPRTFTDATRETSDSSDTRPPLDQDDSTDNDDQE